MSLHASWVHGNAVTVENPENCVAIGHYGWGGDVALIPGKASWFHLPLPTPVITAEGRTRVQRFFVMFSAENCQVRAVHIYDGSTKVQEFNDLHPEGDHRTGLDGANTFDLASPHTVLWGMGISFFVQASIGFDTPITTRFIVASGGADFVV